MSKEKLKPAQALLDSGATESILKAKYAKKLRMPS